LRNAYKPHLGASSPLFLSIRLSLLPQTIATILNIQYGTLSTLFHVHLFQNQNFTALRMLFAIMIVSLFGLTLTAALPAIVPNAQQLHTHA